MGHQPGVLIGSVGIRSFAGNVIQRFAMLALVASHHVHRLLDQVEIEVLVTEAGSEVKVSIDKCLAACVEESVNIALVPTSLLYGLELAVKIVKPLPDVALIRLESVIPWGIIERDRYLHAEWRL